MTQRQSNGTFGWTSTQRYTASETLARGGFTTANTLKHTKTHKAHWGAQNTRIMSCGWMVFSTISLFRDFRDFLRFKVAIQMGYLCSQHFFIGVLCFHDNYFTNRAFVWSFGCLVVWLFGWLLFVRLQFVSTSEVAKGTFAICHT
jgi:hypothetical protein